MPIDRPVAAAVPPPDTRAGTVAFWEAQGAPPHVAQGIADRVNAESSFKAGDQTGDSGTSGGMYQHHADRLAGLKAYADKIGKSWTDPMVQHERALAEVHGADPIAAAHWREILSAPDRATAAKLWDRYFERSAGGPGSQHPAGAVGAGGAVPGYRRMPGRMGGMGPQVPDETDAAASSSLARTMRPAVAAPAPEATAQVMPGGSAPVAAATRPLNLSPVTPPQAPNLKQGYLNALAEVLAGRSRSPFG